MTNTTDNDDFIPSNLSTAALDHKLKQLREEAKQHSLILTQRLASSQSGQNLLHMGSSLSTLPPDLHSLLTQLHPLQTATEQTEDEQLQALQAFVAQATTVREKQRRIRHAQECANVYIDLVAAERAVAKDTEQRRYGSSRKGEEKDPDYEEELEEDSDHPYGTCVCFHFVIVNSAMLAGAALSWNHASTDTLSRC